MDPPVIRVAIADDAALLRAALRGYLERVPGIECVGEATHAEEAIRLVRTHKADVLVLDPRLPGSQELDALRRVREGAPHVRVIVLTAYPAEQYAAQAMLDGASAYLQKASGPADQIVREIPAAAGARQTDPWILPRDREAAPGDAPTQARPPNGIGATSSHGAVTTEPVDIGQQSIARTVFGLLLLVVSTSMTMPAVTLHALRSQSPWLDQVATLLLSLMPGVELDHVIAFCALGVAARCAYPRASAWHCALFLLATGALTELVQVWSPGRDPRIYHVLLDAAAGACGFGLAHLTCAVGITVATMTMRADRSRVP